MAPKRRKKKVIAPKRRAGASLVDKLMSRAGASEVGRRLGVSARTIAAWQKQGPPAARREEVAAAFQRSERSRRAAAVRRDFAAWQEENEPPAGWEPIEATAAMDRAFELANLKARIREIEDELTEDEEAALTPRERARRRLLQVFDDRQMLDETVRKVANEGEFSQRELYTMFFSPEVA